MDIKLAKQTSVDEIKRNCVIFLRNKKGVSRVNDFVYFLMNTFGISEIQSISIMFNLCSEKKILICINSENNTMTIGLIGVKECVTFPF